MRYGNKMYKKITCVILEYSNGCSVATFFSLLHQRLIKEGRKQGKISLHLHGIMQQYVLTKLGKSINL